MYYINLLYGDGGQILFSSESAFTLSGAMAQVAGMIEIAHRNHPQARMVTLTYPSGSMSTFSIIR